MKLDKSRRKVLARIARAADCTEEQALESAVDLLAMVHAGKATVWGEDAFNAALAGYAAHCLSVYAGQPLQPVDTGDGKLVFVAVDEVPEAPNMPAGTPATAH